MTKQVKTKRVYVAFNRTASVIETGAAAIDIEDTGWIDWSEVEEKAQNREFAEFRVHERDYDEEDWAFTPVQEEEPGDEVA